MKKLFTLLLFAILANTIQAQQKKTITGTVLDEQKMPLPGISVLEKGTSNGTSTAANGKFSLSVNANAILVFSSVGYSKIEIPIGSQSNLNVTMKAGDNQLEEVVVTTALGIKKQKRELGFSVTELSGSDLAKTNEINPINALQGKAAGVQIDQGGGGLFGTSKIVIRGNSTLGTNNQPIFVVDGVIMDNGVFNGTGRDFGNDLKNLNSDDFESVSILRGGAAAALYGSRAINGVVLITTKKGRAQDGFGVSLSQTVNVLSPYAGPDFQNEFGGGSVGAFFTDNREPNYKDTENWTTKTFPIDPVTGKPYIDRQINRELENWGPRMLGQDVINYDGTPTKYLPQPNNFLQAFQTGVGSNTNIAVDGGNEKMTFRLSYNHNEGKGVVANNKFDKDAFDLRATHKINKFISVDAGINYSNFNGKNPPRLGGLDAFASYNFGKLFSWILPRNYDTNYWMNKDKYTSSLGGAPDPGNSSETNKAPESRFWFNLFENNYYQREQLLRGRVTVTADLTPWAKFIVEGNINNIYLKNETKELGEGTNFSGGSYQLGFQQKLSKYMKGMFAVNKELNKDLTLTGYLGAELQKFEYSDVTSATSGGLLYPGSYFIGNSVNPAVTDGGISFGKEMQSIYASADFGFRNMLFLQATWRGDWSSALTYSNGTGNNFFNYPAVSLSWIFTDMLKPLPSWVSFGKLKANIAALGKDTDPYIINPGYSFSGFSRTNGNTIPTSTYSSSDVLQPNIKPERKISKELGLEMRFLKSRVGFDVTLYRDNTKDQILRIPAPREAGVSSILINAGNIQNTGIEITLDANPVKTSNFNWNTAVTFSRNKNKIIELYPGRNEFDLGANIGEVSTWAVVGGSYGVLRSQINSKAFQAKDANGNNISDPRNGLPILSWRSDARAAFPARSNEWQDIGDINAKFRSGFDNTFTYKNFSLNVLLDAKIGGDFVALSYRFGTHTGVFPNSVAGRDAQSGGITWTSAYDNQTYDDGRVVEGVFAPGQTVTQANGNVVNVGGMTFKEALDKGFVEPTHTPQFFYRYGSSSTGVSDYWVLKNSWIALRQVAISYNVPKTFTQKLKLKDLSIAVVGRDLGYLYQSLPYNFNPASNNSNNTAFSGEQGFLPKSRNFTFSLKANF
ncbi:SusC/RagA family TonB-linked outer membrane protein [Pedobacter nyackensis]|uniref:SusC/RagA family TonB-linked outer membrane protein n=1 Tax=Pedobacter nyackensis TaxID=475255 RepID=UPI002931835D|nr:SusC/RagA family TonB-linked outer membrane protein [Pedobacter nyackensis]